MACCVLAAYMFSLVRRALARRSARDLPSPPALGRYTPSYLIATPVSEAS